MTPNRDSLNPVHSLLYPPRHPTDTTLPKATFCVIRAFQGVPIYFGYVACREKFLTYVYALFIILIKKQRS